MRVAIIGSRQFNDYTLLDAIVNKIKGITHIVSGGAIGADTHGVDWAKENNIPFTEYKPNWKLYPKPKYGLDAIFKRNEQIANDCDMMVAFWTGEQKGGTWFTICKALDRGIPVTIVKFDPPAV